MKYLTTPVAALIASAALTGTASADGKQIFLDANCAQCHSVSSEGITATMMNLELDGIGAKSDAAAIAAYLSGGLPHPMPWTGSDDDLNALSDWLSTK